MIKFLTNSLLLQFTVLTLVLFPKIAKANPVSCASTQNQLPLYFPKSPFSQGNGNVPNRCVTPNPAVLSNPAIYYEQSLEEVAKGSSAPSYNSEMLYFTNLLGPINGNLHNPFFWGIGQSKLKVCNILQNANKQFVVRYQQSTTNLGSFDAKVWLCKQFAKTNYTPKQIFFNKKTIAQTVRLNMYWSGQYAADYIPTNQVKVYDWQGNLMP